MENFTCSTKIFWGEAIKARLEAIKDQRILIVCDGFLVDTPLFNEYLTTLQKQNQIQLFSDIVPDPPIEKVIKGIVGYQAFQPQVVIGIGGGSAIDTAKAMSYFVQELKLSDPVLCIALPTTSGTGSEVTSVAVVTDPETNSKYPIVSESILPHEAWLDERFVATCPPSVTANSGLDVLTHALEALVATGANPFSDALVYRAVKTIFETLEVCYSGEASQAELKAVNQASCMAGLAFQNAGLGIVHAISHQLGGVFHKPHGLLNALLLPYVIKFNAMDPLVKQKYADLARDLGYAYAKQDDDAALERLLAKIKALKKALDCDLRLRDLAIDQALLLTSLKDMVAKTKNDFTFVGNPVIPSDQKIGEIILSIY